MRPSIILAMPCFHGLEDLMTLNLQQCGFDVINVCYPARRTVYPNVWTRIKALYRKHILHDRAYQKSLRYLPYTDDFQQKMSPLMQHQADYALCIRPNVYPHEMMQTIRQCSKHCVAYQWDGIDRFPDIMEYVSYFDRFFVFDQSDVARYPQHDFQAATNFYFDCVTPQHDAATASQGLYFLGGFHMGRLPVIQAFLTMARAQNVPLDFRIQGGEETRAVLGDEGVHYLGAKNSMPYLDNLDAVQRCQAIVEFVAPEHSGLSFRVFEALAYRKKLITTNPSVANYPFYHQDNILIWQENEMVDLAAFLAKPYVPIADDVVAHYGFSAWIGRMLAK